MATAVTAGLLPQRLWAAEAGQSTLRFEELSHGNDRHAHVAAGYDAHVLLRWGDPVTSDAPIFDPQEQTPRSQARQFGYNCDFIAFLPLPRGSRNSNRGLLCVNHEYTNTNLMFPDLTDRESLATLSKDKVDVELAAHGHSVVEVVRRNGRWQALPDSPLNRRITALDTLMNVSGPAAGHPRLQTSADPSGTHVLGTLNDCAGGVTPWGTVLICEENFHTYFSGDPSRTPEAINHQRYGVTGVSQFSPAWATHHPRFNLEREPHEPNRFGWVVEFDPYNPSSTPVKRTALGRFKHEGTGIVLNHDGRVVVYCGDDERFDYIYRFVSSRAYDPDNRRANRDLLDEGVLSVARFSDQGTMTWLPLVFGQGPLNPDNGFHSQADVVIEARRAADLLGATPMDRPEDVESCPTTGHVFVVLTNNSKRTVEQVDPANPRANNEHGHILELIPPAVTRETSFTGLGSQSPSLLNHAADQFQWEVFLRAGDPSRPSDLAKYHEATSSNGWFSSPDNATFDCDGRMWLSTDCDHQRTGFGDGVYACDTVGPGRALPKLFFRGPRGSELTGICLTPDCETLFVSVQHPAEEEGSDFEKPSTRWPDDRADLPPRPSVVAITRQGGGRIGS